MLKTIYAREDVDLAKIKQRYFAFEGILCSGKTTQLKKAKEYLTKKGLAVACFEEASEVIRQVFRQLETRNDWIDGHLFCSDSLYQNELIKQQSLDTMILEERCFISSLVYQKRLGKGRILRWHNMEMYFDDLNPKIVSQTLRMPETLFILDVSVSEAFKRAKDSSHRIEKWDTPENLATAREGYAQLMKEDELVFPVYLIKELGIEETWAKIVQVIDKVVKEPLKPVKLIKSLGKRYY